MMNIPIFQVNVIANRCIGSDDSLPALPKHHREPFPAELCNCPEDSPHDFNCLFHSGLNGRHMTYGGSLFSTGLSEDYQPHLPKLKDSDHKSCMSSTAIEVPQSCRGLLEDCCALAPALPECETPQWHQAASHGRVSAKEESQVQVLLKVIMGMQGRLERADQTIERLMFDRDQLHQQVHHLQQCHLQQ